MLSNSEPAFHRAVRIVVPFERVASLSQKDEVRLLIPALNDDTANSDIRLNSLQYPAKIKWGFMLSFPFSAVVEPDWIQQQ
jgi:hypothetical protein